MKRPVIARLLVRLAPRDVRDSLVDDLDEAFRQRIRSSGPLRARLWYWRQALSGIVPLLRMRSRGPAETDTGSLPMTETLWRDVRYAIRLLQRSPGFALAAIATMALGIGASTAVFSVVDALLLKPLPYSNPEQLVTVWQDFRPRGGPADEWATPGNLVDWRAETSTFASMAAIRGWRPTLTGLGDPEPVPGERVTQDYFSVLGVAPALGRFFRSEEMVPNAPRVVVISHGAWMRRFGGDRNVLGRTMMLGAEPHEIIGVLPEGFRPIITRNAEVWRPDTLNFANPSRGAIVLRVVARLQPGVTLEQASASMNTLAQNLEARYPDSNTRTGINVIPLHERVVGNVRPAVLVLFGAVVFVMLITVVNVANLLLARAPERAREMAVRAAMGARRSRVVRQLLTESVLLALVGGIAGVVISVWGVQGLTAVAPEGTPRLEEVRLNATVLLFSAAVTLLTGMLFGLAPAFQLSRRNSTSDLKEGARGAAATAGQRVRRTLIVAELAVALILVIAGGLLLRSFLALQRSDLGFDPHNVLVGFVAAPATKYRTDEQRMAFQDRLLERVSALPGVRMAAISSVLPLDAGDGDMNFLMEGMPPPRTSADAPATWYRLISADYFSAIGITVQKGRQFAAREAAPVVIINEAVANRYLPGQDPLGRRMRFSDDEKAPWFTIVGVVREVKQQGARSEPRLQTFIPYWQFPREAGATNVVLKTSVAPESVGGALRQAVREIDPDLPVAALAPMTQRVADSIAEPRFLAVIVGVFAGLSALLAAIGVYGVIAYSVRQRTAEIGVRLALGAGRPQIIRLIFGDGLRMAAIGVAVGAPVAYFLTPLLGRVLFGVAPADPLTFAVTIATLLAAAGLATFIPALRATRIDPATALRVE